MITQTEKSVQSDDNDEHDETEHEVIATHGIHVDDMVEMVQTVDVL